MAKTDKNRLTEANLKDIREKLNEAGGQQLVAKELGCHVSWVNRVLLDVYKANKYVEVAEKAVAVIKAYREEKDATTQRIKEALV